MFRANNTEEFLSYGPGQLSPERQADGRLSSEKAMEMIDIALREGSHYFEWTHKRIDGEDFPATVLLTRVELDGKQSLQATVRDITERKRAEALLLKSNQRYDNLVANIPVGVYLLRTSRDGSMSFDFVSPKVAEMVHVPAEQILADTAKCVRKIHPDDLAALSKLNRDRIREPRSFDWEGRFVVDGAIKWVRIESTPELIGGGNALWNGVISDITERKKAEILLRENRGRLKAIFEGTNIGLAFGDLKGRFLELNPALERILGYNLGGNTIIDHGGSYAS